MEKHLKNWRDKWGSDLDKAKAYLADRNHSVSETAKLTGISESALFKYKAHPESLANAAWDRVTKLARLQEADIVAHTMDGDEEKLFSKELNDWFTNLANDDPDKRPMIRRMQKIIMNDQLAVMELYKSLE